MTSDASNHTGWPRLVGALLKSALWDEQLSFVNVNDTVYALPGFHVRTSATPEDFTDAIPIDRRIVEVRDDEEGGYLFVLDDGSVLTWSLYWDPYSEQSDFCFDYQSSDEASEWKEELLEYPKIC